jgi:hypothetical protein
LKTTKNNKLPWASPVARKQNGGKMKIFNVKLEAELLKEARRLFEAEARGVLKWDAMPAHEQIVWVERAADMLGLKLPKDLEAA